MTNRNLLAIFAISSLATAQTWTILTPAPFPTTLARRAGGFAYHPAQNGLVMYGGLQSGPTLTLNETWAFDGGVWTQLTPATTPPPRWGHRMVYDSRRGRLVTFGGRSPTTTAVANDTWEWDGANWQQIVTPVSPNARAFYGMAYDERRGVTVIYGTQSGSVAAGGNQTWEYNGTTWAQVVTPTTPPGLEQPAMAYDKGRGVVVMFGGFNGTPPGTDYRTTYEYDGIDWVLRPTVNAPVTGYRAGIVYDDTRGRLVLYGGFGAATAQQGTWEYDGNDWTQVASTGPAKSTEGFFGYLPTTGQTVHFGGSGPTPPGTVNNETWLYGGAGTAIAAPYGAGCATGVGIPSFLPTTVPQFGTNYTLTLSGAPALTVGVVIHGTDNLQLAPGIYLPFDLTSAGIAGCSLQVRPDLLLTELVAGGFTHVLPIPNLPTLFGTQLFSQALVLDNQAPNGFGGLSNAIHGALGN
jgi:hypothetical protein